MPEICAVVKCKSRQIDRKNDGVHLYSFPKVRSRYNTSLNDILIRRRMAWIRALKRGNFTDSQLKNMRICSLHFIEGAYKQWLVSFVCRLTVSCQIVFQFSFHAGKPADFQQVDHPDWVPTLNMGYSTTTPPSQQRLSRYERKHERMMKSNEVPVQEDNCEPMDSVELNRTVEVEVCVHLVMPFIHFPSQPTRTT